MSDRDPSPQVLAALELLSRGVATADVAASTGLPSAFVCLLAEEAGPEHRAVVGDVAALQPERVPPRDRRRAWFWAYAVLGGLNIAAAIVAFVTHNATLAACAGGVALLIILDTHRRAKRIRRDR